MKIIKTILILLIFNVPVTFANSFNEFEEWKFQFKKTALANDISEKTIDTIISNVKTIIKYNSSYS